MARWFDKIDNNFTVIPNELIEYSEEMNLSASELLFLLRIIKHNKGWTINTSKVFPDMSEKTAYRRRKELEDKGLIKKPSISRDYTGAKIATLGVKYDLSPLEELIYKKRGIYEEKEEIVYNEEKITENNTNKEISEFINKKIQNFFENLSDYDFDRIKSDFPKFLNFKKYIPTSDEISCWKEEGKSIDMFNYFDKYLKMLVYQEDTYRGELIQPRISFLLKNKIRFNYFNKCYEEIKGEEMLTHKDVEEMGKFILEVENKEIDPLDYGVSSRLLEDDLIEKEDIDSIIDEIISEDSGIEEVKTSFDDIPDEIINEIIKEENIADKKIKIKNIEETNQKLEDIWKHADSDVIFGSS